MGMVMKSQYQSQSHAEPRRTGVIAIGCDFKAECAMRSYHRSRVRCARQPTVKALTVANEEKSKNAVSTANKPRNSSWTYRQV